SIANLAELVASPPIRTSCVTLPSTIAPLSDCQILTLELPSHAPQAGVLAPEMRHCPTVSVVAAVRSPDPAVLYITEVLLVRPARVRLFPLVNVVLLERTIFPVVFPPMVSVLLPVV